MRSWAGGLAPRSLTQDGAHRPDVHPSPPAALRSRRRSDGYASVARLGQQRQRRRATAGEAVHHLPSRHWLQSVEARDEVAVVDVVAQMPMRRVQPGAVREPRSSQQPEQTVDVVGHFLRMEQHIGDEPAVGLVIGQQLLQCAAAVWHAALGVQRVSQYVARQRIARVGVLVVAGQHGDRPSNGCQRLAMGGAVHHQIERAPRCQRRREMGHAQLRLRQVMDHPGRDDEIELRLTPAAHQVVLLEADVLESELLGQTTGESQRLVAHVRRQHVRLRVAHGHVRPLLSAAARYPDLRVGRQPVLAPSPEQEAQHVALEARRHRLGQQRPGGIREMGVVLRN